MRKVFNMMHDRQPAVVVQCTGTADVVDAVNFAREQGLAIAVRGGGHSIAGLSSIEGGMLLDLASMNGVQVDPERRIARVEGGALWGDVDRETQAFGLVAPGGVVSDTGVAGLTLGGGYGWVRRKHGLSCDSLVEAQVVCADGEVRTASEDSNPDLFWALRGGGGNFGVVTSFTFELHELGPMVAFSATMYPLEELAEVLRGWRDYARRGPERGHLGRRSRSPSRRTRRCRRRSTTVRWRSSAASTRATPTRGWRRPSRCASSARRCSTCRARPRSSAVQTGLRPAVPARRAAGLLEGDSTSMSSRTARST